MRLKLSEDLLKLLKGKCKTPAIKEALGWHNVTVDSSSLETGDAEQIRRAAESRPEDPVAQRLLRRLKTVAKMADVSDSKRIGRLEMLAEALRNRLSRLPNKILFMETGSEREGGDELQPWLVTNVYYRPPGPHTEPATIILLAAQRRGALKDASVTLHSKDLPLSISELYKRWHLSEETPELLQEHAEFVEAYVAEREKMGEQFLATGVGRLLKEDDEEKNGSWWRREFTRLDRDGLRAKVVMDDAEGFGEHSGLWTPTKWGEVPRDRYSDDPEEGEGAAAGLKLPVHPYVRIFSLRTHEYVEAHIRQLELYRYDETLGKKLVLPADSRELIDALTNLSAKSIGDIISGKARGNILICSGPPGTGKTLTAEVYSEVVKRPLYCVQCSQLGIDLNTVERKLGEVLARASRWKAILLIDEADVYVHDRGDDMHQNAIVGVFLRLLEYYSGILFMTTNRATVIDDAILSRASAHVRYDIPKTDREKVELWRVLAEQFEVKELDLAKAVATFPTISGRGIRQLLKLARTMADRRGKAVTIKDLLWAAKFHDLETAGD